jgi:SpoVK/Ycf46/Vps4 family AAA+-type ATPase
MLARAVATESKSTFFAISASSLTSKFLGESEKLVRALFQLAKLLAPSIIFVDEIDSLLSSRSGGEHEATRRIKTEFLIQWSDLQKAAAGRDMSEKEKEKGDATRVLVLAATNLPWAIDEAARRRFVRRQYIPLPEDWVRKKQVQTLLSHQKHELTEKDMDRLVKLTESMSGLNIRRILAIYSSCVVFCLLTVVQIFRVPTSQRLPRTRLWDPCAHWARSSCR